MYPSLAKKAVPLPLATGRNNDMGLSIAMRVPHKRWMVYFIENLIKREDNWWYPLFWETTKTGVTETIHPSLVATTASACLKISRLVVP